MKRLLTTAMLVAALAWQATAANDEADYDNRLRIQLQAMAISDAQRDDFMRIYAEYQERAAGAARRVTLYGGDFDIRVRKELNRVGRSSVKKMSKVLTPDQMEHYEALIEIANERQLAAIGLQSGY